VFLTMFVVLESFSRLKEVWFPPFPYDPAAGFYGGSPVFVRCPDAPPMRCTAPSRARTFQDCAFETQKPQNVLRIAAFGGSSVYNLDDHFDRLGERLDENVDLAKQVEIINCGGNSYGSTRLAFVAREMAEYDPDLFLVYSGHNEFEDLRQEQSTPAWSIGIQRKAGHSAFYRLLRDLALLGRGYLQLHRARNDDMDLHAPDIGAATRHLFSREEIHARMDLFGANLQQIIDFGNDAGATTILGTVPSNLVNPAVKGWQGSYGLAQTAYGDGRFDKGRDIVLSELTDNQRYQSSPQENAIIRDLAAANRLALADVERAVEAAEPHGVPGETLFRDHCHLNDQGNDILITTFEAEILVWIAADRPP